MKEELYKIGQEVNQLMQDPSVPNEFKLQGFRLNLYEEWKTVVAQTHPLFDASAVSPSSIGARYAEGGGSQIFASMKTSVFTTLQSIMNAKLSLHGFWHCHENGLIKTIQTIPHNLYVSFK